MPLTRSKFDFILFTKAGPHTGTVVDFNFKEIMDDPRKSPRNAQCSRRKQWDSETVFGHEGSELVNELGGELVGELEPSLTWSYFPGRHTIAFLHISISASWKTEWLL